MSLLDVLLGLGMILVLGLAAVGAAFIYVSYGITSGLLGFRGKK